MNKVKPRIKHIDTLIHAKWVMPIDKKNSILENHSIAIAHGLIVEVLPTSQAKQKYTANTEIERPTHAVMPGFVNAHGHTAMTLMRGIADDLPLTTWLEDYIWPIERAHVNEQFVKDGAELAIAEMLQSGTTTFSDMYYYPNIVARCARDAGIRACVGIIAIDTPSVWAKDMDEYISKGMAVHDEYRNDDLIHTIMMPHAPHTVCDKHLKKVFSCATELNIPLQTHVSETAFEVETSNKKHGHSPVKHLNQLGLIGPDFTGVHMVHIDEDDMHIMARNNASVVHCPESNMKLGSGIAPVTAMLKHGINVAIGTAGVASNNDLDMMGEMRTASLLAKAITQDATTLDAHTALRMATLNGAKALGVDHLTGSLEKGKSADLIAIDLDTLHTQPTYCPASHIVFTANKNNISDVWVHGEAKVSNHQLTGFNAHTLLDKAKHWQSILKTSHQQ